MKITSIHSWLHSAGYRLGQVREQLGFVAPLSEEDYKEVAALLPTIAALSLFHTMSPADQQHSLRVCRRLKTRGCSDVDMLIAALLHDVGKAEGRVPFWTRPAIVLGKKLAPQLLKRLIVYPSTEERFPPVGAFRDRFLVRSPGKRARLVGAGEGWRWSGDACVARVRRGETAGAVPGKSGGRLQGSRTRATQASPPIDHATPAPTGTKRHHHKKATPESGSGVDVIQPNVSKWRLALCYAWYHADIGADLALNAELSERAVLYIRTHHRSNGPAAELHEVDEVS